MFGYDNDTALPMVIITSKDDKIAWTHETDTIVFAQSRMFTEILVQTRLDRIGHL